MIAIKIYRDGREECLKNAAGKREYQSRIQQMLERQLGCCCNCRLPIYDYDRPTFEHEIPRGLGGGWRDDRILVDGKPRNGASHARCNAERGSRRTPIWHGPEDNLKITIDKVIKV